MSDAPTTPEIPDTATDTRGAATRADLLSAALDLFGRDGYHGTSNRALAEAAGVNQALIGYHFGGKKGLYLAVFEHIAAGFEARLGPTAARLRQQLESDDASREDLVDVVVELVDRAAQLFASPETARWAMLIVREQQNPSDAFDVVWNRVMSPTTRVLTGILGRLVGTPPDDDDVRLLTLTLMGQALVFRVARETAVRLLGWDEIGPDQLEAIRRRLRRNVRSLLRQEALRQETDS